MFRCRNNNDVKLDGMYYTGEGQIDLKLADAAS